MKQKWLIFLICATILGVIYARAVFAQQKEASVGLKLYVNPVLYSKIKDGQLLIKSNSDERISVYEDSRLIYSEAPSSRENNLQLSNYSSYSFFTIIPAI
jgi:hypothetical protein